MEPEKSIALRPRFEVESKNSVEKILERAKTLKSELKSDYQIKIIDDHLQILNVSHPPIMRPLGCIHHKPRTLNNAARVFFDLLK